MKGEIPNNPKGEIPKQSGKMLCLYNGLHHRYGRIN